MSEFYNTTALTGDELKQARNSAQTQDQLILAYMLEHPTEAFTRDEIHERVLPNAQNTSVTRALNTLMNAGRIQKLKAYRMGRHGAKQHLWMVLEAPQRRLL